MFENYFHFHPNHDKQINDMYLDQDDNTIDYDIEYQHHDNRHLEVDNNEVDDLIKSYSKKFSLRFFHLPCSLPFSA